jgi:hypothetical protein
MGRTLPLASCPLADGPNGRDEPDAEPFALDDDSPALFSVRSGASSRRRVFDIVDRVKSGLLRRCSMEGTLICGDSWWEAGGRSRAPHLSDGGAGRPRILR